MVITILVDNKTSWIVPYAELLVKELSSDHDIQLVHESKQIPTGDIACFLSCENINNTVITTKPTQAPVSTSLPTEIPSTPTPTVEPIPTDIIPLP